MPKMIIDGNRLGTPLSSPGDLFIADSGRVYIADTGNDRIIELSEDGGYLRSIGDAEGPGKLNKPEGVFVDPQGTIYAANTGGNNIVIFNAAGEFVQAFGKPESNLLYDDYHFLPSKLVVDRRGVMYIVVKDTHQGLFRMNAKGEFTGFFGANKTKLTFMDRLQRAILTKEQEARLTPKRPNAIENITLTDDGFLIVTSSGSVSDGQIRKLNPGGQDAFHNQAFDTQLVDTAVDDQGFLYTYSRRFGNIAVHDPTGFQLVFFGASDSTARQHGVTAYPTAIEVSAAKDVWLLDSSQNVIQVFGRTSFGETFMKANELYFNGEYEASKPYWEEVVRQNGMMDIALSGLGKAAMSGRDYAKALAYFAEGRDPARYTAAFWYVRYEWLQKHFVAALAAVIFGLWGAALLYRKRRAVFGRIPWPQPVRRWGRELRLAFFTMFHPYEGFYRLKETKLSWTVILFLAACAVAVNLYAIFGAGLLAYPYDLARVNIPIRLGLLLVPWATWIVANYLVSAVKGGEGRFREIVQASAFGLMPYILFTAASTLVSNVLVAEEWVIIDLLEQTMWIWTAVLFFALTQVTHNFEFVETAKNIGITLFTICVIWIFAVIMIALTANLADFIRQIYREVIFLV
jgi:sugar lactone lactonase YvrE